MENNNYKEIRALKQKIYTKKVRKLFWAHWLCAILGHFGIILGLHFWYHSGYFVPVKPLSILVVSCTVFYYYLRAMSKLRKKRLLINLILKGYQQESAEEIIGSGKRYALYLRGFSNEYQSMGGLNQVLGLSEETETLGITIRPGHVESVITQVLNKDISLISLADPRNPSLFAGSHRFLNVPVNWEEFITNLLPEANPIFFHYTSPSPGIIAEVKILAAGGWSHKTIVIARERSALLFRREFKYQVYDRVSMAFTRKEERNLGKDLVNCLLAYEGQINQKGKILDATRTRISLVTSTRWQIGFKFFFASLLWFIIALLILVKLIYRETPTYDLPVADIGLIFVSYYFMRVGVAMDRQSLHNRENERDLEAFQSYMNSINK